MDKFKGFGRISILNLSYILIFFSSVRIIPGMSSEVYPTLLILFPLFIFKRLFSFTELLSLYGLFIILLISHLLHTIIGNSNWYFIIGYIYPIVVYFYFSQTYSLTNKISVYFIFNLFLFIAIL